MRHVQRNQLRNGDVVYLKANFVDMTDFHCNQPKVKHHYFVVKSRGSSEERVNDTDGVLLMYYSAPWTETQIYIDDPTDEKVK